MGDSSRPAGGDRPRRKASTAHAAAPGLPSAALYLPKRLSVDSLRRAEQSCRGCELYRRATQAVAGEGPANAAMVMVGEVPGDAEDKQGHPFVGPAGRS